MIINKYNLIIRNDFGVNKKNIEIIKNAKAIIKKYIEINRNAILIINLIMEICRFENENLRFGIEQKNLFRQ